jgi:hypothetical protein
MQESIILNEAFMVNPDFFLVEAIISAPMIDNSLFAYQSDGQIHLNI